jgi:hypothetical protein
MARKKTGETTIRFSEVRGVGWIKRIVVARQENRTQHKWQRQKFAMPV